MPNLEKPSKRILIFIAFAVVVITLLLVNKFYKSKPAALLVEPYQNTEVKSETNEIALIDTDEDGLPDWQETITGTNINNKDTDSDGTSDGAELKLGRNPTVRSPGDEDASFLSTAAAKTANEPTTVSDTVSRNLFANAVYLSNNGEVTEESKEQLVNNLISGIQKSFTFKQYTEGGLNVISLENQENVRFYASSFATLQVGMILQMQQQVLKIENDVSILGEIYAKQASDLYALQVPVSVKDIHLQIVNNYSKGAAVFDAIAAEKQDPIKLPFAIKTYQEIIFEQPTLIRRIAQYIRESGIIFTSNEVGGYWNAAQ